MDRLMRRLAWTATVVSAVAVLLIVGFLLYSALPLFASGEFFSLMVGRWRTSVEPAQYGIGPMIVGSLCLSAMAVVVAFPVGIAVCAFAHGLAPRPLGRLVLGVVHFMTSIPTVIYGFVSVFLLVPLVRGVFGGSGLSLLAAGIALAVLILPTIVLLLHVRLQQTDPTVRLTCAALGMTATQTHVRVLLPLSREGLVAAAVLGFCRAVGDTLIALMVAGNATQYPTSLLDSVRTLTSHIALVLATDTHSAEYRSVFAAGLLLFCLTAVLSIAVRRLCHVKSTSVSHAEIVR